MDATVFIVDDDPSVRDALGLLLGVHGYRVALFANAEDFLALKRDDWHGCLLIDIRMHGMDGLSLQKRLREDGCGLPVIVITAHGDVASARQAFRAEAVDFLEKPIDQSRLLAAIEEALGEQRTRLVERRSQERFAERLNVLTPREREVMNAVVAGRHNREIALDLGISVRTVEVHKARMMSKLGADSVPELVRISLGVDTAKRAG